MGGIGAVFAIMLLAAAHEPDAASDEPVAESWPLTREPIWIEPKFSKAYRSRSSDRTKGSDFDMGSAADLGRRWGTVTSTMRTVEHNREVGGVPNSFHLHGRAIDIARRPGVRHAQLEAAFRKAGYQIIESLDEGDHSHFAFGQVPQSSARTMSSSPRRWRIGYTPAR